MVWLGGVGHVCWPCQGRKRAVKGIEMAGHEQWKVGRTQSVTYGPGPGGKGSGYGFSIQDQHGGPLLSFSFATEKDSKEAEAAVREALEKVVYIQQ
jgi:hypothetical protein